jgi:hypothetical protein
MLIKRTNLVMKDAACLDIVQILEHPTSRPKTKSTQTTTVNTLKKNFSPLCAAMYGKSINRSTRLSHQATEGKSRFDAERVQTLGALRNSQTNKKQAAERRRKINFVKTKGKEKWIKDYMETETALARKGVEDAETAMKQEQKEIGTHESGGLTSSESGQMFEKMLDAMGHSLSNLGSLDDEEDEEDAEDTVQGMLSKDDEPDSLMGSISKTVNQRID